MILFKQIHEIVYHGGGGYDYDTVYNMPVWLRLFTFNQIKQFHDKINNTNNTSDSKTLVDSEGVVQVPKFLNNRSSYG